MIKQFTLSLLAVLLLGSCSNRFSLVKRKYNKGYHFSVTKNPNKEKSSTQLKDLAVQPVETNSSSLPASSEKEIIASEDFQVQPIGQNSGSEKSSKLKKSENSIPVDEETSNANFNVASGYFKEYSEEIAMTASNGGDGGVKLLVLVILAILLPPLAIYLKKKSLDKWFWITLILCLLSFSVFFFVFGGLTYLIAIIIALMVVLDAL